MKTIFVSIICYEDLDVLNTVRDMYMQALHPQRVRAVVILQTDTPELYKGLEHYVDVEWHPASWAEGCGKGRNAAFELYQGETYFFQIDSHMRFEYAWDQLLIDEIQACPSEHPILTTLPTGFVIATEHKFPAQYNFLDFKEFYAHIPLTWGINTLISEYVPAKKPEQTGFLAGGCTFGPGEICKIGYDPYLYFHGEEYAFNIRLWTRGYDNFCPRFSFIYHAYRSDQINPVTLQSKVSQERDRELTERSLTRVQVLTGVKSSSEVPPHFLQDLELYGLGSQRTVVDWERRFGLNLKLQSKI